MVLNWLVFLVMSGILISSCSISHNASDISNRPNLAQVVNNHGSMTHTLKLLDKDLSVDVLKAGVESDKYERIVALKLSRITVIVAISQTNIHNKVFKDLIANSDVTPLGVKLFAPGSPYKRLDNIQINHINLLMVGNKEVRDYLGSLGYSNSSDIIERTSQFAYQSEILNLVEYILQAMNDFVSKH